MFRKMLGAAMAVAVMGGASGADAQEVTLKVHHFLGPQAPQHAAVLAPWCDKLAKESNDKLKCQIFPAMQLGGTPPQLYDQARDGIADVILVLAGYAANRFPRMEVFELPFMMTNAEATSRAAWDYQETLAKDEFAETKLLATFVHGPGNIYTTKKKIEKLDDFKGLKLRAPTRQTNKLLAMMGASPVGMPVPAVPEAISKGVIDGAVIPYEVAPAIKMNELVKHTAETDRSYNALYTAVFLVAMNKAKYDSLPADLKKVLDANSGGEVSGMFGKAMLAADAPAKEKMLASGVEINVIPAAELDKWKKASDALDDAWVKDMDAKGFDGKKLLQSAQDLTKKYTK
ncbi:TRAP transporter substrate-binding protein [Magnetospirillum moscoviense]|uniref:C4-dicarboxylate ABC transporter n=1 Tax=Magnetospirillum moscoviense TaxID=1437059 RepID=A0A178N000_9PROT|nr:TRAP transporter substrate-binding protein [Magnetospirillum moscoviense]MBF0325913.1 TRAP transporter substrate-binding protein [Alphaproteobacteria bacterium]OAN57999.1 C4-dicarboxylate ABC transporter [Magnetospirillum moscoviense]